MPSATVTRSKPSARAPTQNAAGPSPPRRRSATMTARRASWSQVRNRRTADAVGEVVGDLAHQHDVHRLGPEGRRTRAPDGARHAARLGQPGRHRASLEPHRHQADAAAAGPAHRAACGRSPRPVPRSARVRVVPEGTPPSARRQSVAHRRRAAEPPVRARDVAERFGDDDGIGGGIVEQLGADAG